MCWQSVSFVNCSSPLIARTRAWGQVCSHCATTSGDWDSLTELSPPGGALDSFSGASGAVFGCGHDTGSSALASSGGAGGRTGSSLLVLGSTGVPVAGGGGGDSSAVSWTSECDSIRERLGGVALPADSKDEFTSRLGLSSPAQLTMSRRLLGAVLLSETCSALIN